MQLTVRLAAEMTLTVSTPLCSDVMLLRVMRRIIVRSPGFLVFTGSVSAASPDDLKGQNCTSRCRYPTSCISKPQTCLIKPSRKIPPLLAFEDSKISCQPLLQHSILQRPLVVPLWCKCMSGNQPLANFTNIGMRACAYCQCSVCPMPGCLQLGTSAPP